ncbi:MAG TPA: hypothetical protein VK458_01855, partial [Myxococcaceae bacterium]|nr:hypothetical protein [Myxococcaceae bacterium]
MATSDELTTADLERLSRAEAPDLAEAVLAFLEQPDKTPDKLPEGALTFDTLQALLAQAQSRRSAEARHTGARDAWQRYLAQKDVPLPARFALADLLVALYERNSSASRAVLIKLAREADLRFGLWGGLKRIYKLAEARHDAEMFGVLAWRFDTERSSYRSSRDVSKGTLTYLQRRAWRYLRQLGQSVPELYPQFAVEVLRHYDPDSRWRSCWVSNHIWSHETGHYSASSFPIEPPSDMVKKRAFSDAWKRSPDPLMRLLDTCLSDPAARFAIQGLRKDFPDALRGNVTPAWLDRLARRPLASAHEFLIETLQGSPEFHQG